jgi:transposase-like protein
MITTRWVPSRKAALVSSIECGALTFAEASRQYDLSPEEFADWKRALATHGLPGLRTTRLQIYKETTVKLPNARAQDSNGSPTTRA